MDSKKAKCQICGVEFSPSKYVSLKSVKYCEKCRKDVCRNRAKEYARRYRERHPDYSYYWSHREKSLKAMKEYYERNKEKIKKRRKEYREKTRTHYRELGRKRWHMLRMKALIHYGGDPPKCACCGESHIKFLTIDHIGGNGNKHRRNVVGRIEGWLAKNNYPEGFQVLCMNCNFAKKGSNVRFCPVHHPELYSKR